MSGKPGKQYFQRLEGVKVRVLKEEVQIFDLRESMPQKSVGVRVNIEVCAMRWALNN